MKIRGNGKAKVLNADELKKVFSQFLCPRDRLLFAICLFTGCRISEALGLDTDNVRADYIVFPKHITKGKLKSRSMALHPQLQKFLDEYEIKKAGPLFPGRRGVNERLTRGHADKLLRAAARRAGVIGVSTHSFRRTALTIMCRNGVPLRTIQEISGHSDLGTLQRYLEVDPEEVRKALNTISL